MTVLDKKGKKIKQKSSQQRAKEAKGEKETKK